MLNISAHLFHFVPPQTRDLFKPRNIPLPRICRPRVALFVVRHRAVHFEKLEGLFDSSTALIQFRADAVDRQRPAFSSAANTPCITSTGGNAVWMK